MKAVVIYAGGQGKRLGINGQKCMVPIDGIPFLAWKIAQLERAGATEFHMLVAHQADEVREFFGDRDFRWYLDDGIAKEKAYEQALPYLPETHFWTYGDCMLDVPLTPRPWSYTYSNARYVDAGVGYRGLLPFHTHRHTDAIAYHLNTPRDLEETSDYLERLKV